MVSRWVTASIVPHVVVKHLVLMHFDMSGRIEKWNATKAIGRIVSALGVDQRLLRV